MFSKKKKKPSVEISTPSNFQHRVHTGFDWENGVFVGLPAQWAGIIEGNKGRRRPIIDPSTITHTDVEPLKVRNREKIRDFALCYLKMWLSP